MFGKSPRGATARPGPNEPARSALAIPHWLWLVFVVLSALSLAALLYLWQPWQPAKRPDAPGAEPVGADSASARPGRKEEYEFYDLLPKQQVTPVPQQEVPVRASAASKPEPLPATLPSPDRGPLVQPGASLTLSETPAPERQPVYILQINSYDNPDEADRQRAEVLLTGLSADVRQTTVNQVVWYRVVSGPYASRDEAQTAQVTLQNSGIDALVVEQP